MNKKEYVTVVLSSFFVVFGAIVIYFFLTRTPESAFEQVPIQPSTVPQTGVSQTQPSVPTPSAIQTVLPQTPPPASSTDEFGGWKTYSNSYFSVRYPEVYDATFNVCRKDCTHENTEGSSDFSIEIEVEEKVGSCFLGLCNVLAIKHQTFNTIEWDYLGPQSYGDVGVSRSFYAYRTTHKAHSYYVLFNRESLMNETILHTFTFEDM